MATLEETHRALELASLRVSGIYQIDLGNWEYRIQLSDGNICQVGPYTKAGAAKARNRALVQAAADIAGGLANLHGPAMGQDKRDALAYLRRRADPAFKREKRKWSPEARERAARIRDERRRNHLANRDAAEARAKSDALATVHAAARIAAARIASRLPSLPPAAVQRLAAWVADPLP